MAVWENFKSATIRLKTVNRPRPRLSLTSDIMSYRRCGRQYGYFGAGAFVPAQATQIFFGTVIHQVLDMCHQHYRGLMGDPPNTLPSDADVERYFDQVREALRFQGVRPVSGAVGQRALLLIKQFNKIEGPQLYSRVHDTEFRLESDRTDYILRGVVDVLARNAVAPDDWARMEIWDYKGQKNPGEFSDEMKNYRWQMLVYAQLYKDRTGSLPEKAILYFLGEIEHSQPGAPRPVNALAEIAIDPKQVDTALAEFDGTAGDIIAAKASGVWPLPAKKPPLNTCEICDIRWSCTLFNPDGKVRLPFE